MTTKSLLAASLAILLFGCLKNQSKTQESANQIFIAQAHTFFDQIIAKPISDTANNNYRANQLRSIRWDQATVQNLTAGDVVLVPVQFANTLIVSLKSAGNAAYNLSKLTTLAITRDSTGQFNYGVITFIPDSIYKAGSLSGYYFIESWQGDSYTKPIHIEPGSAISAASTAANVPNKEPDLYQVIQVCNEVDGYNYSPDDPDGGESWTESTCNTYSFAPPTSGLLFNPANLTTIYGGRFLPSLAIELDPPRSPIGNIADYMKCFTPGDNTDHKFSVTLAVEQPVQGSRQPWSFTDGGIGGSYDAGNPVNVGHTWLIFTESTAYGTTTRNVGFYPSSRVSPLSASSQGVLADDEASDYDISLTVTVTSNQFFAMLNYVAQGNNAGYRYDLSSNNCTTFALDAMDAGNVAIPATIGTWTMNGQGLDPGDLGEDIRNMGLQSNMTKSTASNYHPNVGSCN